MFVQSLLFADTVIELLRDAEGGVVYHPNVVPAELAQGWYEALRPLVPWRQEERPMYDRIVAVPRLMASVSLNDPSRPRLIDDALAAVQGVAPAPYTRVGLNLYRDGQDSVAMHHDRIPELVPGWPITILSLGAARDMLVKPKGRGVSRRVRLEPGSVLVMSHASQHTHLHGIPKTAEAVGPRISVAFRVRRPAR